MNRLTIEHGPPDRRGTTEFITLFLNLPHRDRSKMRGNVSNIAVDPPHHGINRIAHPRRVFGNGIHHGLKVRRRTCDHPKNFARRGLLFHNLTNFLRLRGDCLLEIYNGIFGRRPTPFHTLFLGGLFIHRAKENPAGNPSPGLIKA